ncbi:hypothetical protein FH972_026024 [Carpinus fangiana]|uniref:diphosphomevalonate decarboxylase n=1 Tax=Carpinus fangiana TaxID=176857 RepID=A0A5N6L2U0_9ROSI|nr:hypothetical protein FH972_026024 [Carpinus fangiana]
MLCSKALSRQSSAPDILWVNTGTLRRSSKYVLCGLTAVILQGTIDHSQDHVRQERTISCQYWGKRDSTLNLPTNSSLSVTLNQKDLRTHTTASCSPSFTVDTLVLNNAPQDISTPRSQACLRELRTLRKQIEEADPSLPILSSYNLRIVSTNNFPTAAGLASSAAGFAAFVQAIANLYALPQSPQELSRIARQGSGSACRSLFGGYVAWDMGQQADGSDSRAVPIAPETHWPDMKAVILVISSAKKDVSSTAGMQTTVKTSSLFKSRAAETVPQRMKEMDAAIQARDFPKFGQLAMMDSNSFHATCADTWPPIFYLNDASRAAIRMVEAINAAAGEIVCAYTFDAGPNAVVFFEERNIAWIHECFRSIVGNVSGWESAQRSSTSKQPVVVDEKISTLLRNGVSSVILTSVGPGPIEVNEHLVNEDGSDVQVDLFYPPYPTALVGLPTFQLEAPLLPNALDGSDHLGLQYRINARNSCFCQLLHQTLAYGVILRRTFSYSKPLVVSKRHAIPKPCPCNRISSLISTRGIICIFADVIACQGSPLEIFAILDCDQR